MDHAMDITTTSTTSAPLSSPLTTKKLEATTFALNDMEIDDSNFDGMLDAFFDPEESFADLPDDAVDEALLCELETFDDCDSEAFSSATAFPEPAVSGPLHAPIRSSAAEASIQSLHSCADLSATEDRLAAMMRQSALSRAQIQQSPGASASVSMTPAAATAAQQMSAPAVHIPSVPAGAVLKPQTIIAASGFLTGKRSTLTNALEQSRRQLQQYMSTVNHMQMS